MGITVIKTSIKKFLAENKQRREEKLKLQKEQDQAEANSDQENKEEEKPLEMQNVKSEALPEEKKDNGFLPPIRTNTDNRPSQVSDGLPYNLSQDQDVTEASPQRKPAMDDESEKAGSDKPFGLDLQPMEKEKRMDLDNGVKVMDEEDKDPTDESSTVTPKSPELIKLEKTESSHFQYVKWLIFIVIFVALIVVSILRGSKR